MAIGKMWPQKDLIELRVIFQDLEDMGYTCYFREVNNIQIYSKHWDGETADPGIMNYNEMCDSLIESIDRLKDIYDIDSIYFNLGLSSNTDWKSVRYDYPPDSLDLTWVPKSTTLSPISTTLDNELTRFRHGGNPEYKLYRISINTSPKKIMGKIKNFLGFNESLNSDISDNIKDVFEDIGDESNNVRVEFENELIVQKFHPLNYIRINIDSFEFKECRSDNGRLLSADQEKKNIKKKLEEFFEDEISHRLDRLEDLYKIETIDIGVEFFDNFAIPIFHIISNGGKSVYITRYSPTNGQAFGSVPGVFNYVMCIFFGKI